MVVAFTVRVINVSLSRVLVHIVDSTVIASAIVPH
jgi:hypothetical protein